MQWFLTKIIIYHGQRGISPGVQGWFSIWNCNPPYQQAKKKKITQSYQLMKEESIWQNSTPTLDKKKKNSKKNRNRLELLNLLKSIYKQSSSPHGLSWQLGSGSFTGGQGWSLDSLAGFSDTTPLWELGLPATAQWGWESKLPVQSWLWWGRMKPHFFFLWTLTGV